jgi:hypothetical protein
MGRRAVEIEVVLLHVLAVVALAVGQPEETLLENGVLAVPQGQREAQVLFVVGNAGDAVFAPAVGPRSRLIVGEEVPGVAVLAVILAHGTPLALAQVGSPFLPRDLRLARLVQAFLFCGIDSLSCHFSLSPPFYSAGVLLCAGDLDFVTCLALLFPLFVTCGLRFFLTASPASGFFAGRG